MRVRYPAATAIMLSVLLLFSVPVGLAEPGPPDIPEGGFFLQDIRLPSGLKLPVFSGPGEEYARAANGKASLSTNGWVQVFGREGNWLLVQYGVQDRRLRIGYVSAEGLASERADLLDLDSQWMKTDFTLPINAMMTDDPLGSRTAVSHLTAGSGILLLGRMGLWIYAEAVANGESVRGFIHARALRAIEPRDESIPFDLRAASWGPIEPDEATSRYWPAKPSARWAGKGDVFPNVWLRLDSTEHRADLEELYNFRVVRGRGVCAATPIPLNVGDYLLDDWLTLHFLPWQGVNRGALEIYLEPGESIENLAVSCERSLSDGSGETITIPLAGVPMDMGVPENGVTFKMRSYTAFNRTAAQSAQYTHVSDDPYTFGGLLEDLFQGMPDAPDKILALPPDSAGYRFFLLEGEIIKNAGAFGVYDVVFHLEKQPPGMWLSAWQEDDAYLDIDVFDMTAGDVILPDGLAENYSDTQQWLKEIRQGRFALLLLVEDIGRDDAEIDRLIKSLSIQAVFSAEKWNISYEQGGLTTAIGPRSSQSVDMREIVQGEGVLRDIP